MLAHYGVVALPCRVRDPDRKGKVESAVGHAQATPLKGLRFETLGGGPGATSIAGRPAGPTRASTAPPSARSPPCSPRSGRTCCRCPSSPSATTGTAPARCTSTAASKSTAPTTPPRPAGSAARSPSSGTAARCGCSIRAPASCSASIVRQRPGPLCHPSDGSAAADAADHGRSCSPRATRAGARRRARCATRSTAATAQPGVRRILGVLALVKKYGPAVVDDACAAALECGVATYRFVRRYLERRPAAPLTLRQVDPLIRELTHYRDRDRAEDPGGPLMNARRTAARPAPAPLLRAWPPGSKPGSSRPRPRSWPRSTSSPPSSRTSCSSARIGCSSAASSTPASATPARPSTPSTSTSTRR